MLKKLLDVAMPSVTWNFISELAKEETVLILFIVGMVMLVAVLSIFGTLAYRRRKARKGKKQNAESSERENGEEE